MRSCEVQYELLRKTHRQLGLAQHVVMLADHNSTITPGVDSLAYGFSDDDSLMCFTSQRGAQPTQHVANHKAVIKISGLSRWSI